MMLEFSQTKIFYYFLTILRSFFYEDEKLYFSFPYYNYNYNDENIDNLNKK